MGVAETTLKPFGDGFFFSKNKKKKKKRKKKRKRDWGHFGNSKHVYGTILKILLH